MDDRPHRISVRTDDARGVATGLMEHAAAIGVEVLDASTVVVETTDVHRFRHLVAGVARQRGARLFEVEPLDDDLESVFRYLVGG
jgi:ABC-2 type transport system ATP-binding protein